MNKGAIQKFAVWARTELIAQVSQRAYQYGIDEKGCGDSNAVAVSGRVLSSDERKQRQELIAQIQRKGYKQVMEEVAYTWFNRFIALHFMEVNNYLPSHIRVFSDDSGGFSPEILKDVLHLDLPGLDKGRVAAYIESNETEALYRYLLLTQCNALNEALPNMFERIGGYTELLFPNNILRPESVLGRMVTDIPEEDWKDAVQIIGWLYQYYNSEPKDETFALLKSNVKISKERIPAATQLFTPDWIVRYMVENSLGRLWIEHCQAESGLDSTYMNGSYFGWKYYLDEAEQEPEVAAQLAIIREEYKSLKPEDIKVIDPCMGSGHILVYAFDVLMQIYQSAGWDQREAVQSILTKNLYGLDIDDRASQLAYFAVMMKARQYDRRIFTRSIQPNVYSIRESNHIQPFAIEYFHHGDASLKADIDTLVRELHDAKEYGSILNITPVKFAALFARFDEIKNGDIDMMRGEALNELLPMVKCAEVMAQKYDVVVTNPPYMGSSGMSGKLSEYVKKNYPDSKSDLFAVFIERCGRMTASNRYQAMITQHAWMFLSSFEKLRAKLLQIDTVNMVHLGARAFEEIGGEVVQTTSFVQCKRHTQSYKGTYCRLIEPTTQQGKENMFLAGENRYAAMQGNFSKIPGSPIAYWVSKKILNLFEDGKRISDFAEPRHGMSTGNNNMCLRYWFEVANEKVFYTATSLTDFESSGCKYAPYKKGGEYRLWYGNNDYVIAYDKESRAKMEVLSGYRSSSTGFFFKPSINWSDVSSSYFGVRLSPTGFAFDGRGASLFCADEVRLYLAALLSTKFTSYILNVLNPTLTFNIENVAAIPVVIDYKEKNTIENYTRECYELAQTDWDAFEASWDFKVHALVLLKEGFGYGADMSKWSYTISSAYRNWESLCLDRFNQLKANEEELNRIFINIYGLRDELTPEVVDKDITVHYICDTKADIPESLRSSNYVLTKADVIKSLISYAVGCMFGRYSLDMEGLAFAGGEWDASKYRTFIPDKDNIIPICDDEYFDDDITGRFVRFVKTVYGADTLEENLKFIADALGGSGTPREVIRSYFLNGFYADHLKVYQKRPIYWLFDSGKKNGFKALIYMHRYSRDLLAKLRTDYVHEQQERYRTQLAQISDALTHASGSEAVKLSKRQQKIQEQAMELQKYEEKIHHLADQNIEIDLDDGVVHNYALFEDVLAKIK